MELTKALLARIEQWQPKLNAFVRLDADEALAEAADADAALSRGEIRGPLHGVPLAHKDMYYRAGQLTECGSKIRAGWIAPATATALTRISDAGAVYLGALHMAEFAYGPTGHNAHLGAARNPWNPEHITGGSSSGSGAAVAARLTAAALGSDTGGSIRMPAHFCGVTGLKPTTNRVSRANAMPLSFSLDTVGPLARTAEDCGLILKLIAGPDPLDPTTLAAPVWDDAKAARPVRSLKIGIPKSFYVDDLTPEVAQGDGRGHWHVAFAWLRDFRGRSARPDALERGVYSSCSRWKRLLIMRRGCARGQTITRRSRGRAWRTALPIAASNISKLCAGAGLLWPNISPLSAMSMLFLPRHREWRRQRLQRPMWAESPARKLWFRKSRGSCVRSTISAFLPLSCLLGTHRRVCLSGLQLIGRPFADELLVGLGMAFQAETDHHKAIPKLP